MSDQLIIQLPETAEDYMVLRLTTGLDICEMIDRLYADSEYSIQEWKTVVKSWIIRNWKWLFQCQLVGMLDQRSVVFIGGAGPGYLWTFTRLDEIQRFKKQLLNQG